MYKVERTFFRYLFQTLNFGGWLFKPTELGTSYAHILKAPKSGKIVFAFLAQMLDMGSTKTNA